MDHHPPCRWIYDRNSIMNYVAFCNPTWTNDGNLTDLDVEALVRTYGPVSDVVGVSTHPTTGEIWTWRSDGQVTAGTVDDLDESQGNTSYSITPGKTAADIVGMTFAPTVVPTMVLTYYEDGTYTMGSATDLDSRSPNPSSFTFAPQVFVDLNVEDQAASMIIDTEFIGGELYTWYSFFGSQYVISGGNSALGMNDDSVLVSRPPTGRFLPPLMADARETALLGVASTGTGSAVFFHDDVTHRVGTPTDDRTNDAVPHLQAVLAPPAEVSSIGEAAGSPIVTLFCNGEPVTVFPQAGESVIQGTPGHDVIIGTAGDDVINGGAGNDTICGRGGDDTLEGSSGNDFLFGGEGNDRVDGQDGHDYLYGGGGNDVLRGTSGHDILRGQAGDDKLWGFEGTDSLWGGDGNDRLEGGDGDDLLTGKKGTDTCTSQAGLDNVRPSCEVVRT